MSARHDDNGNEPAPKEQDAILIKVIYSLELELKMGEVMAGLFLQSHHHKIGVKQWYTVGPYLHVIVDDPDVFSAFVIGDPQWANSQSIERISEAS